MEGSMSLSHALLGLLSYRPSTGYELKTAFNRSIHFFWNATLPQIYRTLKQMEGKGYLTLTVEHQDGKPSRKIYHVTEAGQEELRQWLKEFPLIPEPRDPMLIKIFFGNRMEPQQFRSHVKRWREFHAGQLSKFDKEVMPIIDQYAKLTGATKDARYWGFTLDYGRRHAKMVMDWCDEILAATEEPERKE